MSELACKPFGAWRVGDTVRCVDANSSADRRLVDGCDYKIASIDAEYFRISIAGVPGYWNHERFELVPEAVEVAPAVVAAPNPYADWKSGDSLRCLEAADSGELLADNHIYEIENGPFVKSEKDRIRLVGLPRHEWNCERFERVSPIVDVHSEPDKPVVRVGSRVRCDDASNGAFASLRVNEIYTVESISGQDSDPFITLLHMGRVPWLLSRFTVLPDEVAPSVPASQADQSDVELISADEARRLADEHFMATGCELRLAIKAAIDAAVAKGESIAHIHMSDSVFPAAERWVSKRGYSLSIVPGFTRRIISWE